jgi:hypothetical protein
VSPPNAREGPGHGASPLPAWPVLARIWQTVDVERTVADLGLEPEALDDDQVIGGQGVFVRPEDGVMVAILEPSTEGPLAESLARHGEGDAGAYVAPPGGFAEARRAGLTLYRDAPGPFGRSALVRMHVGPQTAPFTVIVEAAAGTIDP